MKIGVFCQVKICLYLSPGFSLPRLSPSSLGHRSFIRKAISNICSLFYVCNKIWHSSGTQFLFSTLQRKLKGSMILISSYVRQSLPPFLPSSHPLTRASKHSHSELDHSIPLFHNVFPTSTVAPFMLFCSSHFCNGKPYLYSFTNRV